MVGAYGVPSYSPARLNGWRGVSTPGPGVSIAALGALGALLLLMPLVIVPLLVKPFAPKWSYGKRVALGLLVSLSIGAVRGIVKAGRKK